jgi:hypothetical protein
MKLLRGQKVKIGRQNPGRNFETNPWAASSLLVVCALILLITDDKHHHLSTGAANTDHDQQTQAVGFFGSGLF